MLVDLEGRKLSPVGFDDVGRRSRAFRDAPPSALGIAVEGGLCLRTGEAEVTFVAEASCHGSVLDQIVDAFDQFTVSSE
jgi:hypothetical protein